MRHIQVRLELIESLAGWRLFALPENRVGWAPIPMTGPRGTPGGALQEFASALYRLTEPQTLDAVDPVPGVVAPGSTRDRESSSDRPYAALKGSLRGDETDAEFDAAVQAQFPNENAKRSPSGDA